MDFLRARYFSRRRACRRANALSTSLLNGSVALQRNGWIVAQFVLLGCISVLLNTSVDFVVAALAGPIGRRLQENTALRRGQRLFSGGGLIALGAYVALAKEK